MYAIKINYSEAGEFCQYHVGHKFRIITDNNVKSNIRAMFYPKMRLALWSCIHCGKIKQSM